MSVCIYIERERERKKAKPETGMHQQMSAFGVAKPEEIILFSLYYYYLTYDLQV